MPGESKLKRRRDQAETAPGPADGNGDVDHDRTQMPAASEPSSKKPRVEANRSLFVRSLPPSATADSLVEFFSQHYPVKHATVITDPQTKTSRGYGFVTFADADDAKGAKDKLNRSRLDGRPISLEVAEARARKPTASSVGTIAAKEQRQAVLAEARKAPKLIVRNLPWSIKTSDQLAALFRSYGKVKFADLPQSKGKLSGFGFVTLRGRPNAEKALAGVNGKSVDGRTLAVDWAVEKQAWKKQQQQVDADPTAQASTADSSKDPVGKSDGIDDTEAKEGAEEDEADDDLRYFLKNHMANLEEEEDEEVGEDELDGGEDGGASLNDDDDSLDASELDEPPNPKQPTTDNSTTLFIRNLPFSTTDEGLKAHFEQFGRIRYARVVMDRATERPAGTGFVCFFSEAESRACLKGAPRAQAVDSAAKRSILQDEMADEKGQYTMDGRIVQVSQAVSREQATKFTEAGIAARQDKDKDKRRLYLLPEGTISASSPLYAALAPTEVKMREQSAAQRKKLIQTNPSLHVSLTRLAIRNVPRGITSKDLKALAREAVVGFATDVKEARRQPLSKEEVARGGAEDKDAEHKRREKGKGVVKQAKIVFENKQGSKVAEADDAGKSRGYGFIEYSSHRWALMGLRWLNGHALRNAAGKSQRLIVEFAIENAQVVARRRDQQGKFLHWGSTKVEKSEASGNGAHRGRRENQPVQAREKRKAKKNTTAAGAGPAEGQKSAARNALEQKIIGRKRIMKKKKANARRA